MAILLKQINGGLSFLRTRLPAKQGQESSKLKASTLVEVLVASVLILIVFAIASMSLSNIFKSTLKSNTHTIDTHLNKLQYQYQYGKIVAKYQEEFQDWNITITQQTINTINYSIIEAIQKNPTTNKTKNKKRVLKKIIDEKAH